MTKAEYDAFYAALVTAESATVHDFDNTRFFEGCLPIEVMAHRGEATLRFGPMKPVGLKDPRTGHLPYAVVQLRQDTLAGDHYSLVGFQTQIKWGDQARLLKMIPGLENAEFVRFGMVHRNTYICGPKVLLPTWQTGTAPICSSPAGLGVEGYVESAGSGLIAGATPPRSRGRTPQRRRAPRRSDRSPITCRMPIHEPITDQHYARHHAAARQPAARQDEEEVDDRRARARGLPPGSTNLKVCPTQRAAESVATNLRFVDMRDHSILSRLLKLNRHVSPHTVRAYESDVTHTWRGSPAKPEEDVAAGPDDLDMTSADRILPS